MATFSTGERKRRPRGDRKSVEMTMHLKQTFEAAILTHLYPKSQIDIYVEVHDGFMSQIMLFFLLLYMSQVNMHMYSNDFLLLQVLQADGGNYCASVNAATLALIDAGIPLKDYVCACSASFLEDTPISDINYMEESAGGPEMIVATLPKTDQMVFLEMNGRLHEDHLQKVIDTAVEGCKNVHTILDKAVRQHVSEVSNCLGWDT